MYTKKWECIHRRFTIFMGINSLKSEEKWNMSEHKEGKLYLCATPIGNLEDITLRVLRTLQEVDLIGAEDTRHTIKLLNHFQIKTPMTSYHEYNKVDKAKYLVGLMKEGKNIALVTDAGTPAISDPGEELVRQCFEAGVTVTSLPGPAACITALTMSGIATRRFAFEAFLPTDKKEHKQVLDELKNESRTIIIYEAPHRLLRTLKELAQVFGGDRKMTVCRELTKHYEEASQGTIDEKIAFYESEEPKGEYVLVIEGKTFEQKAVEKQEEFAQMTILEHLDSYLAKGMDKKEAMKLVAKERGVSKRDIYQADLLR